MSDPFNIINKKKNRKKTARQTERDNTLLATISELDNSTCLINLALEELERIKHALRTVLHQP